MQRFDPRAIGGSSVLATRLDRRDVLRTLAGGSSLAMAGALAPSSAAASPSGLLQANPFGEPTARGGTYTLVASTGAVPARGFIPLSFASTLPNFLCKLLYTPLVFLDREWKEYGPGLATAWEWSADGLQLTLPLRDDVTFHDGQPFTARDVEFTLKMMVRKQVARPSVPDVTIFQGGQEFRDGATEEFPGVEVIDDHTVRINLASPSNVFLRQLSSIGILPAHAFPEDALTGDTVIAEMPFFLEQPIGTGPFKLASYDPQTNVTFEKNPTYFKGEPILDRLVLRVGVAATAQIAGLRSGEFDGVYLGNLYDGAEALEGTDSVRIEVEQHLAHGTIFLVAYEKEYLTPPVLQALLTALDIPALIETVGYGFPEPLPALMMYPTLFPNDSLPVYAYDPERARQLLAEGGWDSGRTLVLGQQSAQGSPTSIIAQILSQWQAVGIETEYRPFDPATSQDVESAEEHEFDVYFTSYAQLAYDPSFTYDAFLCDLPSNATHYCNPRYDELIAQAIRENDEAAALELYRQVQTLLQIELPYMPFWIEPMLWGFQAGAHGGILGRGPMNDVLSELWWKE